MILWTIQHQSAWNRALRRGVLRADGRYIWRCHRRPYEWMRHQLAARIGPPPHNLKYPVWAWFQYESAERVRPDLRHAAHLPAGEPGVLIQFDAPDDHVLLSDFELWHYVLNDWYLPRSTRELRAKQSDAARQRSWQRVFDLRFAPRHIAVPMERKSIQAVLWQLPMQYVKTVREFVSRARVA